MRTATLTRNPSTDQGTFGHLLLDSGFSCVTGELPWNGNAHDISCIPLGTYTCKWLYSPSHGRDIYHVMNVPNRGNIEIHSGNWCGNVAAGYKSDVLGCIILGDHYAMIPPPGMKPQMGVANSTATLAKFESDFNQEDFQLTIK